MFQALPVRATRRRRRRRRSAMSTICINRAAAAGPLGHDEPRFCACCAVQRSRVSLGDGSSVCERRGSLSARGYLPVFSLALLVISVAGGRRSAKTLPQPTSRTKGCSGRQILQRVSLRRAVARVNPRCRADCHMPSGPKESGRMRHPAEKTPPLRFMRPSRGAAAVRRKPGRSAVELVKRLCCRMNAV